MSNKIIVEELHQRKQVLSSHLSKELAKKLKCRSLTVRTGDQVKIMRGDFKGKTGVVDKILKYKVYVRGIERVKKDGSKAMYPIHASNLCIIEIVKDNRRL